MPMRSKIKLREFLSVGVKLRRSAGNGNIKLRIEVLEKALHLRGDEPLLLSALAASCQQADMFARAIELYEKAVSVEAAGISDLKALGNLYARAGQFDGRVKDIFDRVLRDEPENVRFRVYMGRFYFLRGHYEEALKYVDESVSGLELKGDILFKTGNFQEAEKVFKSLVESQKEDTFIFKHAKALYKEGDIDSAIIEFQKTCAIKEYEAASVKYLGLCFLEKELPDIAARRFQKALELAGADGSNRKEIYYFLGLCYEKKGDITRAKDAYKEVVLLDFSYRDVNVKFEKLSRPEKAWADEALTGEMDLNRYGQTRYSLVSEIGRGGMGVVFKAQDRYLERVVAIKMLHESLSVSPKVVQRFVTEAKAAAVLNHPHIVNIYDVGGGNERKYISMEYVEGGSLREWIEKGMKTDTIVKTFAQICSALSFAHEKGIVHRDIKPDNVLLTKEGDIKLADFGVAKMHGETAGEAKHNALVGTPLYVSPEQLRGEDAEHRSDIYSLGILLYEMMTGRTPFVRGDIYYQHLHVSVLDPEKLRAGLPQALKTIAMKCLEKKKENRYSSVGEILMEISYG